MSEPETFIHFAKQNWIHMGVFFMGLLGFVFGMQARKDKHNIDKSTKFNIDVDTLNDSFDLSQKLLKNLRLQLDSTQSLLDDTQSLLDKANTAYKLLEVELLKAREENNHYKLKIANLNAENKELQLRINSCEFDCNFKKDLKIKNQKINGTDN